MAQPSAYDPPETIKGSYSTAGDVWSLGATMFEALTQHPPASADARVYPGDVSATLPDLFAGMVRQCLYSNPAERPTVADLETQLQRALPVPVAQVPVPQAPVPPAAMPRPPTPQPAVSRPNRRVFIAALVVGLAVVLMVWAVMRNSHPTLPPAPAAATVSDSKPAPSLDTPRHPDQPTLPEARISRPMVHEEIPDVPHSARDTIHGRIKVAVRVAVDSAGNVTHAALETPGTSKYFDHVATQAAGKWKFAPAERQEPRQTVVRFEFTRSGTVAHASPSQPSP
jgi:TonB family protein